MGSIVLNRAGVVPGQCSPPGALLRRMRRYRRKSCCGSARRGQEEPGRKRRKWVEGAVREYQALRLRYVERAAKDS